MEDILKLDTVFPDPNGNRWKVGGILREIQDQILQNYQMYDLLIVSLRNHGQVVPIRITTDKQRLRDGIHRVAIASSMGWNNMLVSTTSSDWLDWNKSEEGQKYYTTWSARLATAGSMGSLEG